MKGYYNTNHEVGDELAESREKASRQRDLVLALFRSNPGASMAPHQVLRAVAVAGTPITSIRRAMTDLTALGHLEKTSDMVMGDFGKKVHTWRLSSTDLVVAV